MSLLGACNDAHVDVEPFVSELARAWQRDAPELIERELVGTLVFADISGFTRLTERLAARGRFGAEEMSDHLDQVLSELLTAAYDHGGWLVKWGGDALLLMFDAPDHARQACAASAAMLSRMRRVGVLDTTVGRVRLRMSVGVHTGTFAFHFLGQHHRELLITGDAATVTARLEATAEAGEILLSETTADLLPMSCRGARKGDGILLARAPECKLVDGPDPAPSGDVSRLVPELVLDHLVSGGGVGEHRHVSVAFLEFSGMSGLQREHGAAAVSDALQRLVEATQDACHRNTVSFHETDISPDGGKIMLVAGAPRGLEDPAEAMLCTLRQVFDDTGPLTLRAGVTAGRAFTGSVGPARRRSYSVKGDIVNLAARVMGKAPAGEIWALPVVVESSRTQFELGDVPRFTVKGKVAPILVRAVGRPLAHVDVNPDLPLIGRAEEMALLQSALDHARQGNGGHIDLIGAAGIGKTRLLAELRDLAPDMTVLRIAAELYRASSPYSLVRPLFLDALGVGDVAPAALPRRLDAWCRDRAPELRHWLPLLGSLLGIRIPDTPQTRDLAPEFRVERLHALVLDLLRLAIPGPSLLVVDDMQFADKASAELLRYVAHNVAGRPWLVVLADRADAARAGPEPETSRTLVVEPMGPEEALVLTCADTDDAPLAPHVTAAVVARGGGNPLFLRQLAATAHTVNDTADLPDSIETVVAARIDRLRPAARDVLRAAAVVGLSIDQELLVELLADAPTQPVTVLDELAEFLATDGAVLRFRQAVIRDAAYEGLAFRRRAALHGKLAGLLADRDRDDDTDLAAVLSLHYFRAGDNEKALPVARAAADRAAASCANAEAALLYRRAIHAAARVPDVDVAVRADLFESLGDVHVRLGEFDESDRAYTSATRLRRDDVPAVARIGLKRARSASQRGGYALTLSRLRHVAKTLDAASGDSAADLRLEVLMRTAFTQFRQGRLTAARVSCLDVLARGDESRNAEVVADALGVLDVVEMSLGISADGARARHALQLHERLAGLAGQARIHNQIGYRAYLDGRWDDAVTAYGRARDLYERLGDLPNAAVNDANVAEILLDQGRLAQAESALRQALRVWRASGAKNDVAWGQALLGRVLARQGRYDDADALLEQARSRFIEQGAKTEVVDADAYQAESLLLQGRYREALGLAERTLSAARRLSEHPVQAPLLYRVIGACQDALGHSRDGDAAFDQALALARRRGADHELTFTVAAMTMRSREAGRAMDPALVAEVIPLQRRLGLVIDLTAESTETALVPVQRSAPDDSELVSG